MEDRSGPSTIVDVAKAAGVSVATVSRALRGLDRVSPRTREKVQRVADELHYVASPTATSLASGQTRIVGVVVPFVSRWYFAAMMSCIGKTLRERGYQVLLFDLEQDVFDRRLSLTRSMLWKRVDGIISINVPMTGSELDLLRGLHVPVVSVGYQLEGLSSAGIDDASAARLAVEHLLALGHRDIAYVGAVSDVAALVDTPQTRLAAALETITDHGGLVRQDWVLDTDWTAEDARDRALALLSSTAARPTAVACGSDEIAFGVHMAARELGLRIPQDLSIVGIDDHPFAGLFSLTTVRQDVMAQAEHAVALLMDELTAKSADLVLEQHVRIDTELIIRASTAAPASESGTA